MAKILTTSTDLVEGTLAAKTTLSSPENVACEPTWQLSLKSAIRSGRRLLERLDIRDWPIGFESAEADFPVFAPLEFVSKMQPNCSTDPLLLQVMALPLESDGPNGLFDPVGDSQAEIVPGLLQKYMGRALLITTGACAIHCRYCFRRHFPYSQAPVGMQGWAKAIESIRQDNSLQEVILSGGDPLSVSDLQLLQLIEQINQIPHIKRIRIHTRFPVVIPSRICDELLNWVERSKAAIYFVLHFNHPHEIDSKVELALRRLFRAGAILLNQSVLLKGVNDSVGCLSELCLRLVDNRVLPYYLHQLDPVVGAMHFQVSDFMAKQIVNELRRRLPGYALPRLVREIAGQPHKTPIAD